MTQLSQEERETIITFDEAGKDAIVYTHNRSWQKHFEEKLGIKPSHINGYGGREYIIPKNRIPKPRSPRQLSAEARKKLSERMFRTRLKSPEMK